MNGIDKLADVLVNSIKKPDNKPKPKPYDTPAEVRRVEGDTAFVHIPGGVDETPVKLTINAKAGDSVQVRVSGGRAFLVGNASSPPTDDSTAIYVQKQVLELNNSFIENSNIVNAEIVNLKARDSELDQAIVIQSNIVKSEIYNSQIEDFTVINGVVQGLKATDAEISGKITAAEADIGNLKANKADISELEANYAHISNGVIDNAKIGYADVNDLNAHYANIDLANVNNAWIQNGVIKDAAITDAQIIGVGANKITAGVIDASKITVTNLNADNITAGTINGQRIGTGSLSLDKLAEEVPTKEYLDDLADNLQGQIDGQIETWTGTTVPTLNNAPAVDWKGDAKKLKAHVGDIYYVVNAANDADGYTYRFTESGSGSSATYSWTLIKDNQITKALQEIQEAKGDITGIKQFDSEISSWKTDTDEELSSLKGRTTTLETDMGTKVSTQTFNELSQTVDENTASISSLSETVDTKADGSTVQTLSNTVNTVKQTADTNKSSITNLTKKVDDNETDIEQKYSDLTQDLSGFKTTVGSTYHKISDFNTYKTANDAAVAAAKKAGDDAQADLDDYKDTVEETYATKSSVTQTANSIRQDVESSYTKTTTFNNYKSSNDAAVAAAKKAGTDAQADLDNYKETNDEAVASAASDASTAKSDAATAKSDASTAKTNASTALTAANTAKTDAATAKSDASTAKSDASTAKTNAASAVSTANAANQTAGEAKTAAQAAQEDLDEYKGTVEETYATKSALTQTENSIKSEVSSTYATKASVPTKVSQLTNDKSYATTGQVDTAKSEATAAAISDTDNKLTSYSTTTQMNSAIDQKANAITASVAETYSTKSDTDTKISEAKAEIKVTTDSISTEVAKKTDKASIISTIRQSAESVKIKASQVEIDGATTFNAIKASADAAYDAKGAATTAENNAKAAIPTKVSQLTNDSKFQTDTQVATAVNSTYSNYGYKYKKDIVVYGKSNKYYPVYLNNDMSDYGQVIPHEVLIERGYGEQAPSDWYTSTHKGGLMLAIKWNYGGWGGATYRSEILAFSEQYSTMVGDILVGDKSGMNSAVYLRGGGTTGALYHIHSDVKIDSTRYDTQFPYIGTTEPGTVYMQSGSYTWTVDNPLTAPNTAHIYSLMSVKEEQYIYISKASGTTSVSENTTWVTQTGDVQNTWTTKRPTYNTSYPVLFIAKQKKVVNESVYCTTPVKDDTTTIIDGGHITTGTIDSNRLNADTIKVNAANIQGNITIGKVNGLSTALDGKQPTGDYATNTALNNEVNARKASYATSSTDAGTQAKVASCSNFALYTGATVTVGFTKANTHATPTLNVNSTGAKTIRNYTGAALKAAEYKWVAGAALTFVYDGTYWRMQDSGATESKAAAAASASTASSKASEAATSASNASSSASTASTKASEAATSASKASTKASEASTSASTASSKATAAANSATTASTKASEASTSASTASSKATAAANSATAAENAKNVALDTVTVKDTRNDNQPPSWYISNYPKKRVQEFKYATKIGLSGDTYCWLQTDVPWHDSSGGYPKQTVEVNGKFYTRQGTAASTWSAWKDLAGIAENYIHAGSDGIKIAKADPEHADTYQKQTSNSTEFYVDGVKRSDISGNGMRVYDNAENEIAKFSAYARIGAENQYRALIEPGSYSVLSADNITLFDIRPSGHPSSEVVNVIQGAGTDSISITLYNTPVSGTTIRMKCHDHIDQSTEKTFEAGHSNSKTINKSSKISYDGNRTITIDNYGSDEDEFFYITYAAYIYATASIDLGALTVGTRNSGYNIGNGSATIGRNLKASYPYQVAVGVSNTGEDNTIFEVGNGADNSLKTIFRVQTNDAIMEGRADIASGECSHAEGSGTKAIGNYSHAEGRSTQATEVASHAEGYYAKATGTYSHAEGHSTKASGKHSHAEGFLTVAAGDNSHVEGKYNVEDTGNKYAHIIGNGSSGNNSNALAVDWNGNLKLNGDVYVNCNADSSGGTRLRPLVAEWHNLDNQTIAKSAIGEVRVPITKSGYTPIGIIGWDIDGGSSHTSNNNISSLVPLAMRIIINNGTTYGYAQLRNNSTSPAYVNMRFHVLYMAN